MAADRATVASGADLTDGLRHRHVPGAQYSAVPASPEIDDKKLAKKVRMAASPAGTARSKYADSLL